MVEKEKPLIPLEGIELTAALIGMPMPYTMLASLEPESGDGENKITFGLQINAKCFYVFITPIDGSAATKVYAVKMEQVVNQITNKLMSAREDASSS